jgi:hypothetical protein
MHKVGCVIVNVKLCIYKSSMLNFTFITYVRTWVKQLEKGNNNEVSLFTWKEDHKDDQPHMIKGWPCPKMQYRTIKGNDNEMMIACMHTCLHTHTRLSNTLLFVLWNSSMWLIVIQWITQGKDHIREWSFNKMTGVGKYLHTHIAVYL